MLAAGGISGMGAREWAIFCLFGIGAVIMRGAGCVINDLWDRDLDAQVERTKARPLASSALSIKQGLLFLATLLLIGLSILLSLNTTTIILGFAALPLVIAYPLMKRITWWPQVFLGLTFNFSALMGWSAITGEISVPALLLYAAGIFWTVGYDTIYAHQDKEDDAMAGIKSTALKFGEKSKIWVGHFYAYSLIFIILATLSHIDSYLTPALLLLGGGAHLIWQLKTWHMDDPASALRIFKSNRDFGLLVLLAFSVISL